MSPGDNAWQLVAATLVAFMSIPGVALLYGGLVPRKWVVNTVLMVFSAFSLVLIVWVLWGFKMAFGDPVKLGPSILASAVGHPGPVLGPAAEQAKATIPLLEGAMPDMRFPQPSLVYFHFAFAAITPVLFLGSLVGRISFKVWLVFVPLWSTLAYTVNAFLLWGGGFWAQQGALDYSGGYVIHLAAGTAGFVAAAVIGPRLARDRTHGVPNNLLMVAAGAGILWIGWNGFNGGDMYFAGSNAAAAVLNTNVAAAVAAMTWLVLDMVFGPQRKPTFLGAVNGMITGLVAVTPAAGYVNGVGAVLTGLIAAVVVWLSWNRLARLALFRRVDDALGVFHTHGVAGLTGGLLVGVFADPKMIVYLGAGEGEDVSFTGLLYGNPRQLLVQAGAAGTVIVWTALVTFTILKVLGLFMRLRLPDEALESGDLAVHDEEVYPAEALVTEGMRPARREGSRTAASRLSFVTAAPEPHQAGVRVRLSRDPESGRADSPPYAFWAEAPGLHARMPVRRLATPDDPYAKEVYRTEVLGRPLERGNLRSLEAAVRKVLAELTHEGAVPRYVLRGPDEVFIPVFRQGRVLRALVQGRWLEGRDLAELLAAVAAHPAVRQGLRERRDLAVLSIAPEDLTGTAPVLAFGHRDLWVPVFERPPATLHAEVAGQDLTASSDLRGLIALRRRAARLLCDSGRLYDPLDLVVTGLAPDLWATCEGELGPPEELTTRWSEQPVMGHRHGEETIAAVRDPDGEVTVWFGRDRFDLAARMELATRAGYPVGTRAM